VEQETKIGLSLGWVFCWIFSGHLVGFTKKPRVDSWWILDSRGWCVAVLMLFSAVHRDQDQAW